MKVELVNDLIAKKVYESASVEDKARAIANKFIKDRYNHFSKSKNMLLSRQELAFIQPYMDELVLDTKHKDYIIRSRQKIEKMRKRKRLRDASVVALVCVVFLSSWGLWERNRANIAHNRYTIAHNNLAIAKDSIGILLRDARSEISPASTLPTAPIVTFHTIYIHGRITNIQGAPIQNASVEVLGATIKSDKDGLYSFNLVLPPPYWKEPPLVTIKKEAYQEVVFPLDMDEDEVKWNPVLAPQH